jgi:hypothetical protein
MYTYNKIVCYINFVSIVGVDTEGLVEGGGGGSRGGYYRF